MVDNQEHIDRDDSRRADESDGAQRCLIVPGGRD
jgi:hypothetical protein